MLAITNFGGAAQVIAATSLRALIGDSPLDDVLAQRARINDASGEKLDDLTEGWGVKVNAVEIREIVPPGRGDGGRRQAPGDDHRRRR